MEFALIIKLVLIGIMLISAISYFFERLGNKKNLKNTISSREPIRELTDAEFELLRPYLDDPTKVRPYKYQSRLVSHQVFLISGECIRHSISTNGNESSHYFDINGIEVFFPYDMQNYTGTNNIAEVVFTAQYAFVINLNGFTLSAAKIDYERKAQLDENWSAGAKGEFKQLDHETIEALKQNTVLDIDVEPLIEHSLKNRCELLEQRDETPLEHARVSPFNTGFLFSLFFVISVIFALNYSLDSFWALIVSGIFLIIAIIFYFLKPKVAYEKVNRVRGTISAKDSSTYSLGIGDSLMVTYPKHWDESLPQSTTVESEFDVTVKDKKLIRYGYNLSISKENEHFGSPKFWGRNCYLFIFGTVLSIFLLFMSDSIAKKVAFTYHYFTAEPAVWTITNFNELQHSQFQISDEIELNMAGATCDVNEYSACRRVVINPNINGLPASISDTPEWITLLKDGKLVQYTTDQTMALMNQLSRALGHKNDEFVKMDFGPLVLAADNACEVIENDSTCFKLKKVLTNYMQIKRNDVDKVTFNQWSEVVDFAGKNTGQATLLRSTVNAIKSVFQELANTYYANQESILANELKKYQQSPEAIVLNFSSFVPYPMTIPSNVMQSSLANRTANIYMILAYGGDAINVSGVIEQIKYKNDGTIQSLTIEPDTTYRLTNNPSAIEILISTGVLLMTLIFTVFQLLILIYKILANKNRIKRIKKENTLSVY